MQSESPEEIRRTADLIDSEIHSLLIRRAAKGGTLSGKEGSSPLSVSFAEAATILRGILSRPSGTFPLRALVRIWSDIFFGADRDVTLHVFGGENAAGFWDLARTHYGCAMPMISHHSATAVVHACADDPRALGLVPPPDSAENGNAWWEQLAPAGHAGPRIAQSLPFVRNDSCPVPLPQGYAIGTIEQEATGADTSILKLECHSELSRAKLQSLLRQAGFDAQILAASRESAKSAASRLLVANRGFVSADDERIPALSNKGSDAISRVALVGGFADPFDATPSQNIES